MVNRLQRFRTGGPRSFTEIFYFTNEVKLTRPNLFYFRVCFTLNLRSDRQREGIISHPSAGDISIPRDNGSAPRRGLILPQYGPYPPTIIPLTHARSSRGSGDYAGKFFFFFLIFVSNPSTNLSYNNNVIQ